MKLIAALLLSAAAAAVQAYDAGDFKGKFAGTDTTGIHSDNGTEEKGKMKIWFNKLKSDPDGDGGTVEGKFFYVGEHDGEDDAEDIVGVWFKDGTFHMIETEQSGTLDGSLHGKGDDMYLSVVLTEPGSGDHDGLVAAGHRLDKK
uniref:Jacalin-type lectin domain-containing protein n=1 Tax=Minutocellus polymorphus TaxID=265543 RepID=A0A7S0APJ7_9STRA|mmetsp:Transcript_19009/g.31514  ORF Transcript_19009/g.31514 Transcript_19009/m.31514 type:complete len:145 (+) Transcript_19009:96-530(+)|eukprot:CAMPEP_0197725952 /NCGR_PEP_ID=MMETSP1434-20131217/12365_1 /TAXON_ID=265543 /ORGANISM="Minutocellus polymorphus, Strain CCMP3303" /LENGTH=144 /DNA_ID=CAMNT_0043311707 /DNA_START=96 /DNA_END=530 /DNA_ORIENTATION=+